MNLFSTTSMILLIQLPRTINFRTFLSTIGIIVSESILLVLTINLSSIWIRNDLSFIRCLWIFNAIFTFSILLTYHVFYLFADIRTASGWKVLLGCLLVNVVICLRGGLIHAFKSLLLWCRRITPRIWSLMYFVLTFILLTGIYLGKKMRFRLKCWILITKWVIVCRYEITTTFSHCNFTWLLGPFPNTIDAAVFFLLMCTILLA